MAAFKSGFISSLEKKMSLSAETAVEALGGSEVLYEKLVKQLARLIPARIEDVEEFLKDDAGLSSFGVRIHGIKGSLMQVGCQDLAMAALSLEQAAKSGDRQYCVEYFSDFKSGLLLLHKEITALLPDVHISETVSKITDYYDTLCQAREETEDYDCISAAESVSKLTNLRFGVDTDALISEAAGALELFQPEKALGYITGIINICEEERVKRGE